MPKKRKRKISSAESKNAGNNLQRKILKSSIVSLIVFFTVLIITAFIMTRSGVSETMQTIITMTASLVSPFLGAFLSLGKSREKGLMTGILMSLPSAVIVSAVLLILFGEIGLRTIIMSLAMLLGGALGGIARVNQRW